MEDQHRYDTAPLGSVVQSVVQDPQCFGAGLVERDRVEPVHRDDGRVETALRESVPSRVMRKSPTTP